MKRLSIKAIVITISLLVLCILFAGCGNNTSTDIPEVETKEEQSTETKQEQNTTQQETETNTDTHPTETEKLSVYERLSDKEKDFADIMLKGLQYFNNPKTVSITYAYYNSGTDSWAITVSEQNAMGGYTQTDYDLARNGKITKPMFNHVKTGLDSHFNLDLINEYISGYANR